MHIDERLGKIQETVNTQNVGTMREHLYHILKELNTRIEKLEDDKNV